MIDSEVLKQAVFQIFRYAMIALGTYLVKRNVISQDFQDMTFEAIIAALFSLLIPAVAVVWGLMNKRYLIWFNKHAAAAPEGTSMQEIVDTVKASHTGTSKI